MAAGPNGCSPLHAAVQPPEADDPDEDVAGPTGPSEGRCEGPALAALLAAHGADLDARMPGSGCAAIHLAAMRGDLPTIKALRAAGARLDLTADIFDEMMTPLQICERLARNRFSTFWSAMRDCQEFLRAAGAADAEARALSEAASEGKPADPDSRARI